MKVTEQYFPEVMFIVPFKEVLVFEAVDKILKYGIQMKAKKSHVSAPDYNHFRVFYRMIFERFFSSGRSGLSWNLKGRPGVPVGLLCS